MKKKHTTQFEMFKKFCKQSYEIERKIKDLLLKTGHEDESDNYLLTDDYRENTLEQIMNVYLFSIFPTNYEICENRPISILYHWYDATLDKMNSEDDLYEYFTCSEEKFNKLYPDICV